MFWYVFLFYHTDSYTCCFFFFQAEDGIRDGHVTGVQTCALPISARVRAVLRRSSGATPGQGIVSFDDVEIDLERRMVTKDGQLVQLSRTEWLLLQHLAANAGKVVLHTEL